MASTRSRSASTRRVAAADMPVAVAESASEAAQAAASAMHTAARAAASGLTPTTARALGNNLVNELNSIDFKKMIGGPLQAAVDAQVASSMATVEFINAVGFKEAEGGGERELVMVDFSHSRKDVDAEGNATDKSVAIRVPLLAMLPIPSLRIEHVIIDFNVKLNSVESSQTTFAVGVNTEVKAGWGPVNFKVSASVQRKTVTNVEVKKEYSLNVNVKAVQDEMPAGLEKILGILGA